LAKSKALLEVKGLRVAVAGTEILKGVDLTIRDGEVHAIMGPNGSGKTTLAYALMGHPSYVVTGGEVHWKGRDILKLSPDKRSRLGMFLAFQYPTAIPGLSVASFIRSVSSCSRERSASLTYAMTRSASDTVKSPGMGPDGVLPLPPPLSAWKCAGCSRD